MMVQNVQAKYRHKSDGRDGDEGELSSPGWLACNRGSALNIVTHTKRGRENYKPRMICGRFVMPLARG
jgi:hypothetical protein